MRAVPVTVLIDEQEQGGQVRILTDPQTFEALEHDVEVTANLDGIFLDDGRHVSTMDVTWFDLVAEG